MNGAAAYWKAKYEALAAGIEHDPALIEGAEKTVRAAMDLATTSMYSFEQVWPAFRETVIAKQPRPCLSCIQKAGELLHQAANGTPSSGHTTSALETEEAEKRG